MLRRDRLAATAIVIGLVVAGNARGGAAGSGQAAAPGANMVVSTAWLADHLDDPGVVVLATGSESDHARAHIPGAGFVSHMATLGGGHGMLEPAAMARLLGQAGARDDARIVLYSTDDDAMTLGWFYMAFAAIGHGDHVSLLSGNLDAWQRDGHAVSSEAGPPVPGRLTPREAPDVVVDARWVRARLEDEGVHVLDVRTARERNGGYVPGSRLILWQDLFEDLEELRFKSRDQIHALLVSAGLAPGQEAVTYCAVGMRASLMYFAARHAGVKARVYLGSWNDWQSQPGFPIGRGGGR